jgi:hypothetical protein
LDLIGSVATDPALDRLTVDRVTVEAKARFDTYAGNVRNHDLVLNAVIPDGVQVVVCVGAKAGEPLGATIGQQARAAMKPRATTSDRRRTLVSTTWSHGCRYQPESEQSDARDRGLTP